MGLTEEYFTYTTTFMYMVYCSKIYLSVPGSNVNVKITISEREIIFATFASCMLCKNKQALKTWKTV